MILHSDGRIEGTPAEIAEYRKNIFKMETIEPNTMSDEEFEKMISEIPATPYITKELIGIVDYEQGIKYYSKE